ncbi:Extracellular exo-alpha-(1-_5)-L-arabinofuranosidase [Fusarium oxysporum f. sp. albedinis]|nr:Extracellular exo-alpha-(1->5)-L-arabinofuranosidase [Fusarium oxysporum f. sp. albedinis]
MLTILSLETQCYLAYVKLIASTGYKIMPYSLCIKNYTKYIIKDSKYKKAENLVAPSNSSAVVELIKAGIVDLIDWSTILDLFLVFNRSSLEVIRY